MGRAAGGHRIGSGLRLRHAGYSAGCVPTAILPGMLAARRATAAMARFLIVRFRTRGVRNRSMSSASFDLCVVIDDDDDILIATALLLRGLFSEVITARTPDEALPTIRARNWRRAAPHRATARG
eukprot:gene68990-94547_t